MLHEIAHALVQRIFKDKILLGLIIVGLLAIFVGGFGGHADRPPTGGPRQSAVAPAQEQQADPPQAGLQPQLATEFVRWWLPQAMDCTQASAANSHQQAFAWMTPEAVQAFQAAFWSPQLAEGVASGQYSGSFTPTNVTAVATNPDGSVVVSATGTWVIQAGQQPVQHQFAADFLVRKEADGLRVAGMYNRTVAMTSSSTY